MNTLHLGRRLLGSLVMALVGLTALDLAAGTQTAPPAAQAPNDPARRDWLQLFNGKDLSDWTIKFTKHDLGVNLNDTVRVDEGMIKIRYDKWEAFNGEFGHIFYKTPFSHYIIAAEYRFPGAQVKGGPGWAVRNNGLMLHAQDPKTMMKDQDFPISVEVQLLGGLGDGKPRTTLNLCTPGSNVVMNERLHTAHCTNSKSKTYDGDQWVRVEVLVLGDALMRHKIDGETVLEYTMPQIGGGSAAPVDPKIKIDGTPMASGYITIQAETAETDFRKIEVLNLAGCMNPKATNYKNYYVKSVPTDCK